MELIDRIKSPTPTFHKKVRNIAVTLTAIIGAILASEATGRFDIFSDEVEQYMQLALVALPCIAGTAQTAKSTSK